MPTGQVGPQGNAGATEVTVLSTTVTLTDAEIKALPSTGIEVIAAPGAGKIIFPIYGIVRMTWVADYANIHAQSELSLKVGGENLIAPFQEQVQGQVSGILAGGGPDGTIGRTTARILAVVAAAPGNVNFSGAGGVYDSDVVNFPLVFSAVNPAGNFTDGNAGNALTVTVLYTIIDV